MDKKKSKKKFLFAKKSKTSRRKLSISPIKSRSKKIKRRRSSHITSYIEPEVDFEGNHLPVNYVVFDRFVLLEKLGKGGFGLIYSALDCVTGQLVAVKLETYESLKYYIRLEYQIYTLLNDPEWSYFDCTFDVPVPSVIAYGATQKFKVMVMEKLGVSLYSVHLHCKKKFSLKTSCMVAFQMINTIEKFHSKGLLHRDIKPGNFVWGRGKRQHNLYLIDFGLASSYLTEYGEHIEFRDNVNYHGTDKYSSISTLEMNEPSRRDDMESIGYVLIYLITGNLPWVLKYGRVEKKLRKIKYLKHKKEISISSLCIGLPDCFRKYFKYVRSLEFKDKPDYDYLRYLFCDTMEKRNLSFDRMYDWVLDSYDYGSFGSFR